MMIHQVREGERLSEIAALHGTTTDAIVERNKHRPAVQLASGERVFASLAAGDELVMPPTVEMDKPMLSKPMIAGGLAVLGLAIGAVAIFFWPKK